MKLLFIYGPPAAGKLTIANEIAKLRPAYKVFHNHALVGSVASIFTFDAPKLKSVRNKLARKFRIELFEEAAKNDLNLIATYGGSGNDKFDFFKEVMDSVASLGGEVLFIQLTPSREAILNRVESDSRKNQKIDNKEFLIKKLNEDNSYYEKFKNINHLTIDNSNLTAKNAAQNIIDYYQL